MHTCFHTTKLENLINILQNGLLPISGRNSALTADTRTGKISYSAGIQATIDTFSVFRRFYNNVIEGRINEEKFKNNLSTEEYSNHQKSISEILKSKSFEDWIGNNIYLCFDGDCISDRHENKPEDAYTSETIPPEQLKVCIIKNKKNDSVYFFSMKDICCFLYAKNPELKRRLGMWKYEEDIDKYRNGDYYMDYISLEQFCELFPKLTSINNKSQANQAYITPKDTIKNALMSGTTFSETKVIDSMPDRYKEGEKTHDK